jgi:hypothetical protein
MAWQDKRRRPRHAPSARRPRARARKSINVGYVPDSMLVDIDGKTKLSL